MILAVSSHSGWGNKKLTKFLLGHTHSGSLFGDLQMSVSVLFSLGLINLPGVESSNLLIGECKPGEQQRILTWVSIQTFNEFSSEMLIPHPQTCLKYPSRVSTSAYREQISSLYVGVKKHLSICLDWGKKNEGPTIPYINVQSCSQHHLHSCPAWQVLNASDTWATVFTCFSGSSFTPSPFADP